MATIAIPLDWLVARSRNALMMQRTVPNRPINGALLQACPRRPGCARRPKPDARLGSYITASTASAPRSQSAVPPAPLPLPGPFSESTRFRAFAKRWSSSSLVQNHPSLQGSARRLCSEQTALNRDREADHRQEDRQPQHPSAPRRWGKKFLCRVHRLKALPWRLDAACGVFDGREDFLPSNEFD